MAVTVAMLLLNRQLSPGPRETTGNAPSLAQLKAVRKNKNPAVSTPTVVIQTNQFHWSSIESADYKAYVANLRSVGCPESTIRDIVLTDLMKYYAGRRGQTLTNGHEFKYWETDEKRKQTASQEAAREKEIARLDREVAAVVRELLGVNYDREINRYFVDTNADAERLRFLSDEKRDRIFALREKFEGLSEQIVDSASTATLSGQVRTASGRWGRFSEREGDRWARERSHSHWPMCSWRSSSSRVSVTASMWVARPGCGFQVR